MLFKIILSALSKKTLVLLIGVGLLAGWYFLGKFTKLTSSNSPAPTITSEITRISAISTNPTTGEIEYQLTADKLTQNKSGLDVLYNAVMDWTPTPNEHYTLTAAIGTLDEKTGDFVFEDGFSYSRHPTGNQKSLVIQGGKLTGNIRTKKLSATSQLNITQGRHTFNAYSMTADLNTQHYEFSQVESIFTPPVRTDTPLF